MEFSMVARLIISNVETLRHICITLVSFERKRNALYKSVKIKTSCKVSMWLILEGWVTYTTATGDIQKQGNIHRYVSLVTTAVDLNGGRLQCLQSKLKRNYIKLYNFSNTTRGLQEVLMNGYPITNPKWWATSIFGNYTKQRANAVRNFVNSLAPYRRHAERNGNDKATRHWGKIK